MSTEDAARWNQRYRGPRYADQPKAHPFLIRQKEFLPKQGVALDIAMGLGGDAGFLLERGLRVIGVDISSEAVRQAKKRYPALDAIIADLSHFSIPAEKFDVILNFYYLQRDLWLQIRQALVPGGLLIMETLTTGMLQVQPEIEPGYLLQPGELRREFRDWEILEEREGWEMSSHGKPRSTASLVVRKPVYLP
jgi:2-polyprenyl-3-methyl-5-hydroxy-6-metoxy-1,4-benzoquinol methylase